MNLISRLLKFRLTRFVISGGSAVTVNLSLLYLFVHFLGMWYLFAATTSFAISVAVSFTLQKYLTFNDYSTDRIHRQTSLYLLIQVANIAINAAFMYVSVDLLGIHYLGSQILSGGLIAAYSFFLYRHFIFGEPPILS